MVTRCSVYAFPEGGITVESSHVSSHEEGNDDEFNDNHCTVKSFFLIMSKIWSEQQGCQKLFFLEKRDNQILYVKKIFF